MKITASTLQLLVMCCNLLYHKIEGSKPEKYVRVRKQTSITSSWTDTLSSNLTTDTKILVTTNFEHSLKRKHDFSDVNTFTNHVNNITPSISITKISDIKNDSSLVQSLFTPEINSVDNETFKNITIDNYDGTINDGSSREDSVMQHRTYSSVYATLMEPTESAAILAAVFVSIAVVSYVGLVVWRRILIRRSDNRQLLINEDHYDVNDLKYFEL